MTQKQKKKDPASWQTRGYRMEDAECEHEPPINDQNDTGYVPGDREAWEGDPFDDSAVDEGLRKGRSADLDSHRSEFWSDPERPPAGTGIERVHSKTGRLYAMKDRLRSLNKRVTLSVILVIVLLVVGAIILVNTSLRVRTVRVTLSGDIDHIYTQEHIDQLEDWFGSLIRGSDIRHVDEQKIRQAVATEPYLSFFAVRTEMPDTVVISLRVRNAYAWINYNGVRYILDGQGMVLTVYEGEQEPALPELKLNIANVRRCIPGRIIEVAGTEGLAPYRTLSAEVKALGLTAEIMEYNLTSADDMMLRTRDGFYVSLGGKTRIHAKLRSMMLVMAQLADMGESGGTIYVTNPEAPTWRP
ncbi:MAG: cell division protein FtsQ/DivIB [Clostridia bacterium]|nr:cell division protein FtsQ/DivIB [Clostridia bacterium]